MQKNRFLIIISVLVMLFAFTGCRGYTDASVSPPKGWGTYTAGPLEFSFQAGWKEAGTDAAAEQIEAGAAIFSEHNQADVVQVLESPKREQGTTDYLIVTCFTMENEVTAEDLEEAMDGLNSMARTIKNTAAIRAEVEQNARIRKYGDVNALTVAYSLENEETKCLIQTGYVPAGTQLYQISYCDFTSLKDDSTLEQILTSLSIHGKE